MLYHYHYCDDIVTEISVVNVGGLVKSVLWVKVGRALQCFVRDNATLNINVCNNNNNSNNNNNWLQCVVIGLQSTGESRTLEQLEESGGELNDFVSTAL